MLVYVIRYIFKLAPDGFIGLRDWKCHNWYSLDVIPQTANLGSHPNKVPVWDVIRDGKGIFFVTKVYTNFLDRWVLRKNTEKSTSYLLKVCLYAIGKMLLNAVQRCMLFIIKWRSCETSGEAPRGMRRENRMKKLLILRWSFSRLRLPFVSSNDQNTAN